VPNDGSSSVRVEVSALKDGVDKFTISGLSGATSGNQRYLVAGINRYDGTQAQSKRVNHAKLWMTTAGWLGDGTAPNAAVEPGSGLACCVRRLHL
jgi:hypothetical protein